MYLITAYFDEKANQRINSLIHKIADQTGNLFMTENHVPPHLTISSVEARSEDVLLPVVNEMEHRLKKGRIQLVSVGMLFPYVMYITPVLNQYLQSLSQTVYDAVCDIEDTSVSKFYRPMQWLPHVTVGKNFFSIFFFFFCQASPCDSGKETDKRRDANCFFNRSEWICAI